MPALARGQASDCSNPALDLFTTVGGVLTDVAVIEFEIYEKVSNPAVPAKVYPVSGRFVVDTTTLCPTGDKISTGRYVALYTPPLTELIGTHEIRWYFKLTNLSPEQTFREEFEVLPEVTGSTSTGYTTIADMREEGVTTTQASDQRLTRLISLASRQFERWTGRFFEPRAMSFLVDGHGGRILQLQNPIIRIDAVRILEADDLTGALSDDLDLAGLRVYNRHISQNLLLPDDRDNPRLEWLHGEAYRYGAWTGAWPLGAQNIFVSGVFGYTDPDGSPFGRTPPDVSYAVQLLVIRNLALLADTEAHTDAIMARRITSLRTRDQSITYSSAGGSGNSTRSTGAFSGDPLIDEIVANYARPPMLAAV